MAQRLTVQIIGDADHLNRTFRNTAREARRFEGTIERTGRSMGRSLAAGTVGFFGTAGLIAGFTGSVEAASDLSEQMSKTDQVFGRSAAEVKAWSETTATAFGISQRQALATASSFGALFAPMGLVGDKARQQSQDIVELGADLASFYNTDVQDALDALRSGIVGESEPLRRYGVLLSEARVQAEALAQTHKQSATDLTAAEKALARITLIMRDTTKAQGDFARTSENLANQSRKLRAEWDDLQANIGEFYIPALTGMTSAANDFFAALKGVQETEPTERLRAILIPKLAEDYGRLRDQGVSAGDAIKQLTEDLGGSGKASLLVADAINYFAGGPMREQIVKLRQEIVGVGEDAELTAKRVAMAGQLAATALTGTAALSPAARAGLAAAQAGLTPGVADDLATLQQEHERNLARAAFARGRLRQATGPAAARWAGVLEEILIGDRDTLDRIRGIQADIAMKARDAAERQRDALRKAREAAAEARRMQTERRFGWLDFAIERAEATESVPRIRRALQARAKFLQELIKSEGRTLERVRELWRTRERIRDLNKSKTDPLTGLMGTMAPRQIAALLAAGTGLGMAGQRRLAANIAGQGIAVYSTVALDGQVVGTAVSRQQARSAHRTARQTSGLRE